ncbi:wiskott-Aldrich syndrome protein family member 1-like [Phalaenopsis equestris]|uniref:wiskott-Aldrich syndrome protein family member 1-like n=1 Tax=Phalaenopsis equestris TaxID=78828 RepID=UPI0009E59DF6|nr:wiskott-Aldrich syndrome protein family member 1-like [Phalaenopsis equestris]
MGNKRNKRVLKLPRNFAYTNSPLLRSGAGIQLLPLTLDSAPSSSPETHLPASYSEALAPPPCTEVLALLHRYRSPKRTPTLAQFGGAGIQLLPLTLDSIPLFLSQDSPARLLPTSKPSPLLPAPKPSPLLPALKPSPFCTDTARLLFSHARPEALSHSLASPSLPRDSASPLSTEPFGPSPSSPSFLFLARQIRPPSPLASSSPHVEQVEAACLTLTRLLRLPLSRLHLLSFASKPSPSSPTRPLASPLHQNPLSLRLRHTETLPAFVSCPLHQELHTLYTDPATIILLLAYNKHASFPFVTANSSRRTAL